MKTYRGIITVEMAYIGPIMLSVFFLSVIGLFYYHDKEVITSCAYEAVVVASTKAREKDTIQEEAERAFQERVRGKCILFGSVESEVMVDKERITLNAHGAKGKLRVFIQQSAAITNPEDKIRKYKKIGV